VCCSVLQCVDRQMHERAGMHAPSFSDPVFRCSLLQCVVVCRSVVAVCCSVMQCVAVCCSVWIGECMREWLCFLLSE